ncbi:N-acetyltransferase [Neobacillus drentensis]|uniref:GNAT family N-acetyltransferase n=1 Tax=Neobacillus drentensis TaxID=220684 RepID=UPI0030008ACA
MINKLIVRQATIEDLPKLVPIFDSYREYFKHPKNPSKVESFLYEKFEHLESVIFIAEQESEVIGLAQLYPIFSSISLQRVWLLNDFYVSYTKSLRTNHPQAFLISLFTDKFLCPVIPL